MSTCLTTPSDLASARRRLATCLREKLTGSGSNSEEPRRKRPNPKKPTSSGGTKLTDNDSGEYTVVDLVSNYGSTCLLSTTSPLAPWIAPLSVRTEREREREGGGGGYSLWRISHRTATHLFYAKAKILSHLPSLSP